MQFFSCDLSDNGELTDEGDSSSTTETDSYTESSLEVDSTSDHNSDSDSDLWGGFDFPQLTAEEDAQLAIALQGDTSQPTTIEASTSMSPQESTMDYSNLRSGVQVLTDQATSSWLGPSSSPPPYSTESNNSQSVNQFFLVGCNIII